MRRDEMIIGWIRPEQLIESVPKWFEPPQQLGKVRFRREEENRCVFPERSRHVGLQAFCLFPGVYYQGDGRLDILGFPELQLISEVGCQRLPTPSPISFRLVLGLVMICSLRNPSIDNEVIDETGGLANKAHVPMRRKCPVSRGISLFRSLRNI